MELSFGDVEEMHPEIEMIVELTEHALQGSMNTAARSDARDQLEWASKSIRGLWTLALEDQLVSNARTDFPGEDYFSQKLTGLISFARMALGDEDRMSYSDTQIFDNVRHFAALVNSIVGNPER